MAKKKVKHFNCKDKFRAFCKQTTLHGWAYLEQPMNCLWRSIWIIFMILIWSLSFCLIYMNVRAYQEARTLTSLISTMAPLRDLVFPLAYICNSNQVRQSIILRLSQQKLFYDKNVSHLACLKNLTIQTEYNNDIFS